MFEINFSFKSSSDRMNSHNAIQYYLIKVNLVSNPLFSTFFEDIIELSEYPDLFWDTCELFPSKEF